MEGELEGRKGRGPKAMLENYDFFLENIRRRIPGFRVF